VRLFTVVSSKPRVPQAITSFAAGGGLPFCGFMVQMVLTLEIFDE
jgi:ABC-type Fe3+-siderophore transport system permease subunit